MCRDTCCTIKNERRNSRMKCKRFLAMLCCICIAFCCGTSTSAASPIEGIGSPRVDLRSYIESLSDDECIEFLEENGVEVPYFYADENGRQYVKGVVLDILENPSSHSMVGRVEAANFYDEIRNLVKTNSMYGYYPQVSTYDSYGLEFSTRYSWNPNMVNYNCYAYALGKWDKPYEPGEISDTYYSLLEDDPVEVGRIVRKDLDYLGYKCILTSFSRPTMQSDWENIIALRIDTNLDNMTYNDYHFARFFNSTWRHKPGPSAVLRFNDISTFTANEWCNEGLESGTKYVEPDTWYESDILYISYKTEHQKLTYTGNNYHSGSRHYCQYNVTCNCETKTVWRDYACSGNPCITPNSITPPSEVSR